MATFGSVVQIVGLAGVVVALCFSAVQTRKLQRQIHIANLNSRYSALSQANERYDAALGMLFQRPQLRPYLLGDKPLDLVGDDLDRALIVADVMAGAVDSALRAGDRFPDDDHGGWSPVARTMATRAVYRAIVREKPDDFPDLRKFFPDDPAAPPPGQVVTGPPAPPGPRSGR